MTATMTSRPARRSASSAAASSAGCWRWPRRSSAIARTSRARARERRRAVARSSLTRAVITIASRSTDFAARVRCGHLRVREYRRSRRSTGWPSTCPCSPGPRRCEVAQDRVAREALRRGARRARRRAGRRSTAAPISTRRSREIGTPGDPQDPRASAMTARARRGIATPPMPRPRGTRSAAAGGARRRSSTSRASSRCSSRARDDGAVVRYRDAPRERPRGRHPAHAPPLPAPPEVAGAGGRGAPRWPRGSPTALDYVGVLTLRILRHRRRPGVQRDGAARAQFGPLDDRGRGDHPVREPYPRDLRPAAGRLPR